LTDNNDTLEPFGSQSLHDFGHIGRDIDDLTIVYISIRNEEQLWTDLTNNEKAKGKTKILSSYLFQTVKSCDDSKLAWRR
jgi:hypothetical protein